MDVEALDGFDFFGAEALPAQVLGESFTPFGAVPVVVRFVLSLCVVRLKALFDVFCFSAVVLGLNVE